MQINKKTILWYTLCCLQNEYHVTFWLAG